MMEDLKGKSILITGGASGIGRATALLLGQAGCNVTIADRFEETGEEAVRAVQDVGGNAQFVKTDVTKESDTRNMVAAAVTRFGRLDGSCNAAGLQSCSKPVHEMTIEDWDRCQDINLRGMFLSNKFEIKAMLAGGGGSIVNIASSVALAAVPLTCEYGASKAGVLGFVRGTAIDYAELGIRVNAVLPGATWTPMLAEAMQTDPGLEAAVKAVHPMKRFAQPREIAAAICWLLSDEASFVTGVSLPVDGGHTAV